jgi:hypothetical protein
MGGTIDESMSMEIEYFVVLNYILGIIFRGKIGQERLAKEI